jgi:16S rRNA U516 pseudouridylate synthase RsuA-like enzyme
MWDYSTGYIGMVLIEGFHTKVARYILNDGKKMEVKKYFKEINLKV